MFQGSKASFLYTHADRLYTHADRLYTHAELGVGFRKLLRRTASYTARYFVKTRHSKVDKGQCCTVNVRDS